MTRTVLLVLMSSVGRGSSLPANTKTRFGLLKSLILANSGTTVILDQSSSKGTWFEYLGFFRYLFRYGLFCFIFFLVVFNFSFFKIGLNHPFFIKWKDFYFPLVSNVFVYTRILDTFHNVSFHIRKWTISQLRIFIDIVLRVKSSRILLLLQIIVFRYITRGAGAIAIDFKTSVVLH